MPFATPWMELEGIVPREICQTEKPKYHTISLLGGILKQSKKQTNKTNKQMNKPKGRSRPTHNKLMAAGGVGWRDGGNEKG